MADEIQQMIARVGADVAMYAAVRSRKNEGRELVLHSGYHDSTVAQYKTDYPTALDKRFSSAMFSD